MLADAINLFAAVAIDGPNVRKCLSRGKDPRKSWAHEPSTSLRRKQMLRSMLLAL